MLSKNKNLSAFAAVLLASATALQPAAAQSYETWNAQGGYNENAPYANYPAYGNAANTPYDQNSYPAAGQDYNGGVYYGGIPDEENAREQAAQQWRSQYQNGTPAEPYQSYTPPANQDYYAQQNQGTYAQTNQGYYAQADQGYATQQNQDYYAQQNQNNYAQTNQGYYAQAGQGYATQQNQDYYAQQNQSTYAQTNQSYYGRDDYYSASDHHAYRRECERQRANNQVGGLVFGAIAGGLLGNVVSSRRNRGGATAIGAVVGGALGAGIASNMNCDDRYYVHQTYYDGFERGYSNRTYQWRNPNTGHHGAFRVGDYYRGPAGQRCATYAQTIWIQGRPEPARGYACRRGDGSWELLS
jgi:surface antigen